MEPGYRYAKRVDFAPGKFIHRGSLTGTRIDKESIKISGITDSIVSYQGTTGKEGKMKIVEDDEGTVYTTLENGKLQLFFVSDDENSAESHYGPKGGRRTRRRRHQRKTRRYRK